MKVLFVSYHFPPEGGPGVQRISKFIKYLSGFGIKPYVLTSKHPLNVKDASLADDLPSDINIIRTADTAAYLPGVIRKVLKQKFVEDKHIFWSRKAGRKIIKIILKENIDLILTSSPPHSVHLAGLAAKKELKTSWIADFRDEWTKDAQFNNRYEASYELEREVVSRCDGLICVTKRAQDNFSKIQSKAKLIRNGFDKDDFVSLKQKKSVKNEKLKIVYSGRFTHKSSPRSFFEALNSMLYENPQLKNKLEIDIIGSPGNYQWVNGSPQLKSVINFLPYMPHKKCIEAMDNSDALLLLSSNSKGSEVFPAKIYEYIYLRKPILAVIEQRGELSGFLEKYGNSYTAVASENNSISGALQSLLSDWQNGSLTNEADFNFVQKFDRKEQAEELFEFIKSVLITG